MNSFLLFLIPNCDQYHTIGSIHPIVAWIMQKTMVGAASNVRRSNRWAGRPKSTVLTGGRGDQSPPRMHIRRRKPRSFHSGSRVDPVADHFGQPPPITRHPWRLNRINHEDHPSTSLRASSPSRKNDKGRGIQLPPASPAKTVAILSHILYIVADCAHKQWSRVGAGIFSWYAIVPAGTRSGQSA